MRVDQVIPSLASRDAIGVHTLGLTRALREAGIDSDIYYGSCTSDLVKEAKPVGELGRSGANGRGGRWLLYQASIGSPVFDALAGRTDPLIVNYHNITPVPLLEAWEPDVAYEVGLGRSQLERLAPRCRFAIADSLFNEIELHDVGYSETAVVPLIIDMTGAGLHPDPEVVARLEDAKAGGGIDLLFVGKVSPHKASHDLVKMLAALRRTHDLKARLHLVGSPLSMRYLDALEAFAADLGVDDSLSITGSLSVEALEAYYRNADVFVCASDHEGFCVPIVEAMARGVPVVAYGAGAVPETLDHAGLVLRDKSPLHFATAVARAAFDKKLRTTLVAGGKKRVEDFAVERSAASYVELIGKVLSD